MAAIEDFVKQFIEAHPDVVPHEIGDQFGFQVPAQGNPFEDFRDEYEQADIIDVRIASRILPNKDQNESYLVLMSSKDLSETSVVEVHNKRFASYNSDSVIVKPLDDLIDGYRSEIGFTPGKTPR